MIYLIDTFAWIEYFTGSKLADKFKFLLLNKNNKFVTMECILSEFKCWCLKSGQDFEELAKIIRVNSVILPVLQQTWLQAAQIRYEMRKKFERFGLMDAILVAKQRELDCKIITGDPHFKNLKNIIYIGK